jgi:hypothetical protein
VDPVLTCKKGYARSNPPTAETIDPSTAENATLYVPCADVSNAVKQILNEAADRTSFAKVKTRPVPVDVAAALITNCVPLEMDKIVAPAAIPDPLTPIPTLSEFVLDTVTVVLPAVVAIPLTVATSPTCEADAAKTPVTGSSFNVKPTGFCEVPRETESVDPTTDDKTSPDNEYVAPS